MDAEEKKRIRSEYKASLSVGAVYAIDCAGNGKRLVKSTVDAAGFKSRYAFAISAGVSPDPALNGECTKYGASSFTLTILAELKMKEGQSPREFAEDMKQLCEMWKAK
jgi:hypothetical protein